MRLGPSFTSLRNVSFEGLTLTRDCVGLTALTRMRSFNPYTPQEVALTEQRVAELAALHLQKPATTQLCIRSARLNRWIAPDEVVCRWAAGGKGEEGLSTVSKQDFSLGLPEYVPTLLPRSLRC